MDWTVAALALALQLSATPPRISESVTVFVDTRLPGAGSATVLDAKAIAASPALAVDDVLRSTPGFTLFRRTSSRAANPTTQGITMRGLAASGASRAAVTLDNVPLNDPVGGWVFWNQIPTAAIARVEIVRGPAGDLFADAIGGTIRVRSSEMGAGLLTEGGGSGTARVSGFISAPVFAAAEWFTTDGYVTVAPESRGPIDTRASSRHTALQLGSDLPRGPGGRLAGAYFDESRGNGTPFQTNSTRRGHVSGLLFVDFAGGYGMLGSYGTLQRYEQTFSAVLPGRAAERPTTEQKVDAGSAAAWLDWGRFWRDVQVAVTGSGRYVNADLVDRQVDAPPAADSPIVGRQMTSALSVHASIQRWKRITITAGVRGHAWRSSRTDTSETTDAVFLSPRMSVSYQAHPRIHLRAGFQSGSRGPTINELYRGFRVGSVLTLPNAAHVPEDAIGFEASVFTGLLRRVALRGVGFWSRVDDAIVNVTQPSPPGLILRQRMNAARLRARGVELEAQTTLARPVALVASAAFTDSIFDRGPLDGLRVPQVPRVQAALGARGTWPRARVAAEWRFIGRQFDDDRNEFELARSSMLDLRAGWLPRRTVELFAAVENVLDEEQDVGRTPLRTIGLPRTIRIGVRLLKL